MRRMKDFRVLVSTLAVLLLAPVRASAQGNASGGNGPQGFMNQIREFQQEFVQNMKAYQQQIDAALAEANQEFRELLQKEDKTFEELRELARLRERLGADNDEVQGILAEMHAYQQQVRESRPRPFGDAPGRRPQLTEEQQQIVTEYREALAQKHEELDAVLSGLSERYAELLTDTDKTREEWAEMLAIRRELLAESEEAQDKLDEIRDFIRSSKPDMTAPRPGLQAVRRMRRDVEAINTLNATIDELLAEGSEEYAELLAQQDKTQEQVQETARLRRQLLTENEQAGELQQTMQYLRSRLQNRVRDSRDRGRGFAAGAGPRPEMPTRAGQPGDEDSEAGGE